MKYSLSLVSGGFARLTYWGDNKEELLKKADKGCGHYWLLGTYKEGHFLGYEKV